MPAQTLVMAMTSMLMTLCCQAAMMRWMPSVPTSALVQMATRMMTMTMTCQRHALVTLEWTRALTLTVAPRLTFSPRHHVA